MSAIWPIPSSRARWSAATSSAVRTSGPERIDERQASHPGPHLTQIDFVERGAIPMSVGFQEQGVVADQQGRIRGGEHLVEARAARVQHRPDSEFARAEN